MIFSFRKKNVFRSRSFYVGARIVVFFYICVKWYFSSIFCCSIAYDIFAHFIWLTFLHQVNESTNSNNDATFIIRKAHIGFICSSYRCDRHLRNPYDLQTYIVVWVCKRFPHGFIKHNFKIAFYVVCSPKFNIFYLFKNKKIDENNKSGQNNVISALGKVRANKKGGQKGHCVPQFTKIY